MFFSVWRPSRLFLCLNGCGCLEELSMEGIGGLCPLKVYVGTGRFTGGFTAL